MWPNGARSTLPYVPRACQPHGGARRLGDLFWQYWVAECRLYSGGVSEADCATPRMCQCNCLGCSREGLSPAEGVAVQHDRARHADWQMMRLAGSDGAELSQVPAVGGAAFGLHTHHLQEGGHYWTVGPVAGREGLRVCQ